MGQYGMSLGAIGLAALAAAAADPPGTGQPAESLPRPGTTLVNRDRGELLLCATVRHPRNKPCIDDWGERIQAFVGCARAAGGEAKMVGYFVFVVDVPTEEVYDGLVK